MRHRQHVRKLGRKKDHRDALLRNLATSLTLEGKVKTTTSKAKALVSYFEHLVALVKRYTGMNAVREVKRHIYTEKAQKAFLTRISTLQGTGGYVRTTKIGFRAGDNSEVSQVEFVG